MSTSRRPWTESEWRDFGARCQAARDRLDAFTAAVSKVPRVRAPILDSLLKDQRKLYEAMAKVEGLIVAQHPDLEPAVLSVVHGPGGRREAQALNPGEPAAALSRAEWEKLGLEAKTIRRAITALGFELQGAVGGTKAIINKFFAAADMLTARSKLDDLVCRQHPDWPGATRVFYGEPADDTR